MMSIQLRESRGRSPVALYVVLYASLPVSVLSCPLLVPFLLRDVHFTVAGHECVVLFYSRVAVMYF